MLEHLDKVVADRLEQAGCTIGHDEQTVARATSQALREEACRRRGPERDRLTHREGQQMRHAHVGDGHDDDAMRAAAQFDVGGGLVEPTEDRVSAADGRAAR
jgi:hypothetical protein